MDLSYIWNSLQYFQAEITLAVVFVVLLLLDLFFKKSKLLLPIVSIAGFIVVAYFIFSTPNSPNLIFGAKDNPDLGMVVIDPFGNFFKVIILLTTAFIVLFSLSSKEVQESGQNYGEYYVLLAGMTLGMFIMTSTVDLLLMYLAIEMVSISSYILAGFTRQVSRSSEASLKYIIFGAVASGTMLYGISIMYGMVGSTNIYAINAILSYSQVNTLTIIFAGLLIIVGLGFKISMAPFHFWTPDVYEGAPITITAILSVASKAAGFAILIRFLKVAFVDVASTNFQSSSWAIFEFFDWTYILAGLSVLTMTLGNLAALWQDNLKRMLAYSSIAHAGYLLMGIVILDNQGIMAILIYFAVYLFMNLGAFFVLMLISDRIGSEEIDDFNGLGFKAPFLCVSFTIFLISLTGIPPTAGFIGKLYLFAALIKTDWIWLAVIGVVNSVVSLYYYVRVIKHMFLKETDQEINIPVSWGNIVLLSLLVAPTIILGVYFQPLVEYAQKSLSMLGF